MKNDSRMPIGSRLVAFSQWISHLKNGLWLIGSLAGVISLLHSYVVPATADPHIAQALQVLSSLLTFTLGVIIGGYTFRKVSLSRDAAIGYRIIRQIHDLYFDKRDPRVQYQTLTTVVEARHATTTIVEYRYHWTGGGDGPFITAITPGVDILESPSWLEGEYRIFYARLHRPISRGETREIQVSFKMTDRQGRFRPCHIKKVRDWLNELELIVRFPPNFRPKAHEISAFRSRLGNERERTAFDLNWDEPSGTATLQVRSPRKSDVYGIEWEWDYPPMAIENPPEGEDMESA